MSRLGSFWLKKMRHTLVKIFENNDFKNDEKSYVKHGRFCWFWKFSKQWNSVDSTWENWLKTYYFSAIFHRDWNLSLSGWFQNLCFCGFSMFTFFCPNTSRCSLLFTCSDILRRSQKFSKSGFKNTIFWCSLFFARIHRDVPFSDMLRRSPIFF